MVKYKFAEGRKEDVTIMAKTIWGEARGESDEGKAAVGWVIRNRAEKPRWWGLTIAGVCLKKWQFSCWNPSDPNAEKIANLSDEELSPFILIAESVLDGEIDDPTGGATHYHVHGMKNMPKWSEGMTPFVKIDHHDFYVGIL